MPNAAKRWEDETKKRLGFSSFRVLHALDQLGSQGVMGLTSVAMDERGNGGQSGDMDGNKRGDLSRVIKR